MDNDTTCVAPDCQRGIHVYRERLCNAHYQQKVAGKPFSAPSATKRSPAPGEPCSFAGCRGKISVQALCARHYQQKARGLPLTKLRRRYVPVDTRNDNGEKWCSTCEEWKDPSNFASSKGKADGLQTRCRPCNAEIYRANADRVRDKMRQQRFGITREEFDALFDAQGRVCDICGTSDPGRSYWCVDHDHACCPGSNKTCGKCIRGILCHRCNHALGNVRDNPDTLARMIEYLAEGVIDTRTAR